MDDLEDGALAQAKNLANLPFTFSHTPLMPDSHQGYGMPIGSILSTEGVIIPNAVGVDIGCGMCAQKTNLTDLSQADLKKTLSHARSLIPLGFNWHEKDQDATLMPKGHQKLNIVSKGYDKALKQIGSLGGGNHIIEIQKGSDGFIWVMIHSGSRNLGYSVAKHYNKAVIQPKSQLLLKHMRIPLESPKTSIFNHMIKSIFRISLILSALLLIQTAAPLFAQEQPSAVSTSVPPRDLKTQIKKIPGVKKVKEINISDHFKRCYEIWFEQHIDPNDKNAGTFLQLVYLSECDASAPVVAELEGYTAYSARTNELTSLLKANQIRIEHRYFDQSAPKKGIPWETLTVENAAYDHHVIINALRDAIYPTNKFISTGISKGGQTTMLHRSFYPNDVDASVCYVAPLNLTREDPRIYSFLAAVATAEERKAVYTFQVLCFEKKTELTSLLQTIADKNGYAWDIPIVKAFEYYVLEYSFAFWQWGAYEAANIPNTDSSDSLILSHLINVSGISFFEKHGVKDLQPYFYAALTEMGIYGYQYEPFSKYLSQQSDYLFDFTAPDGRPTEFDPAPMKKLNDFIQNEAETILFIYGEYDTWSATAVELSEAAKERGLKKFVNPGGHHGTRIGSFDSKTKAEILNTIVGWIGE